MGIVQKSGQPVFAAVMNWTHSKQLNSSVPQTFILEVRRLPHGITASEAGKEICPQGWYRSLITCGVVLQVRK